jgi:hypothetical protein
MYGRAQRSSVAHSWATLTRLTLVSAAWAAACKRYISGRITARMAAARAGYRMSRWLKGSGASGGRSAAGRGAARAEGDIAAILLDAGGCRAARRGKSSRARRPSSRPHEPGALAAPAEMTTPARTAPTGAGGAGIAAICYNRAQPHPAHSRMGLAAECVFQHTPDRVREKSPARQAVRREAYMVADHLGSWRAVQVPDSVTFHVAISGRPHAVWLGRGCVRSRVAITTLASGAANA